MVNLSSGGVIVAAYEDKRILFPEGKESGFFCYQCRHSESDMSVPETIERHAVWSNFWGTVVTLDPLIFDEDGIYNLTREEGEAIAFLSLANDIEGRFYEAAPFER